MDSAEVVHRLQFAITATFHYLFPQLTMGLALLLVAFQTLAWRTRQERYARAGRFWLRIFAVNFAFGVVTGIPLEFQFGTNWSRFSEKSGGVIGQTLAMEGMFAFFLESTFLGLLLFGGKRLSERGRWIVTTLLWFGTWLSGYFIVTTNAWMQHPVGYAVDASGHLQLESIGALLLNPWAIWQYLHTMMGSVMTAAFVMAGAGAFYLLGSRHEPQARLYVRAGVLAGLASGLLLAFPTGDYQAQNILRHQPATFSAMEGLFETRTSAPLVFVGQPDMEKRQLDNAIELPGALSFLTHRRWDAEVKGLDAFPERDWPQNIPLLYYAYHVMVGLGTLLILLAATATWRLRAGRLFGSRALLWLLVLAVPFPYIANTMGWMTTELGRQPWVIWGVQRTADAYSSEVSAGNALFTLIGFCGIYLVLGILFLALVFRKLAVGPEPEPGALSPAPPAPSSHPGHA